MAELSELGRMLMVGRELGIKGDQPSEHLANMVGVSGATLKRYLAELRLLGAVVVSRRVSGGWVYRFENWDDCAERLLRWLELERSRRLLDV